MESIGDKQTGKIKKVTFANASDKPIFGASYNNSRVLIAVV